MNSYEVKVQNYVIAGSNYQIRSLKDVQQFYDPLDIAKNKGINSAIWPLFGVVWPSELILAEIIGRLPLAGLRVLEVGCGLGLASLVASRMGACITAGDYHPLAEEFLLQNSLLNQLPNIKFINTDWRKLESDCEKFDLIIGSDLLYEPNHPALLSAFINHHAALNVQVILTDPGRQGANKFTQKMELLGYSSSRKTVAPQLIGEALYRGKELHFRRSEPKIVDSTK